MLWKSVLVAFAISSVPSRGDNDADDNKSMQPCPKIEIENVTKTLQSQETAKSCGQISLANFTMFNNDDGVMKNMAKMTSLCIPNCLKIITSLKSLKIQDCSIPVGGVQMDLHDQLDNVKEFCEKVPINTINRGDTPAGPSTPSTIPPASPSPPPTASGASTLAQSLLLLSSVGIVAMMW